MNIRLPVMLSAAIAASTALGATPGSDDASAYGGSWLNGSGAGNAAFGTWSITPQQGTGYAGSFIGDPSGAGIIGMPSTVFGLYANPGASGASVSADRTFNGGALSLGQTFQFDWGINWDSGNWSTPTPGNGNKGFNLYSGGTGGAQLVNVNNAGSSVITLNGTDIGFGYGGHAMTWSFTLLTATSLRIQANDRDGSGVLDQTIAIPGAPDSFRLYATELQAGDQAQPYFNTFQIVPEPASLGLALLGALGFLARRRLRE